MKKLQLNPLFRALAAAGLCTALTQPLYAETVQTDAVTVTASRVEKELSDVNMSVTVITADEIRHSSARSVGELLQDVAGVTINNDGGQGIKRVKIRGENAFRTLVMIDGQKVAEHKSMSGAPMLIDPSQIERIEVIKGPASVLYGSDAIGGAVNIITKKGGSAPLEGEVSAGLNTSANGKSASAGLYGAYEGWKYRFNAGIEDNDNLDTPVGEMENTYFKSRSASLFVSYDVTPDLTVGGTFDHYDLEFGAGDYETPGFAVDVPEWKRTKGALFAEMKNISDTLVRLRADVFYQDGEKEMINTVPAGPTMKVLPIAQNTTKQTGVSLQSDWQLGDNHYLIAGYEFSYDDLDARSITKREWSVGGQPMSKLMSDKTYLGHQMTNALYASMETVLPADFTLNYGVRYTWVESEMESRDLTPSSEGVEKDDSSDSKAVFNVGVIWTGIDRLALRASYSQGYRSPILQELYVPTAMGTGTVGATLNNPDLKAETSDNFEVGARWAAGGAMLDAALFYSEADDYITTIPVSGNVYQYANVAKARSYGLELTGSALIPGTGFEPYAALAFVRRQYDDGNGFKTWNTGTPLMTARYGVRWTGEYQGLALRSDVYARTLTKTKYEESGHADDYELGSATTLNLTGGISFGPQKQYTLDAGLYNVFDKAYRESLSIYEPGRHFAVKLNARF